MIANIKLIHKEEIANQTMAFRFTKPSGFEFRAGQFGDVTLINPSMTDSEGNTRAFSIASAPYEPDLVFATRLRDTAFKRAMQELPVGAEVKLDAPYGDFTLHKTETTPAVFIIGGIGVTPVRSMIAQATHDQTVHRIVLIHANRSLEDAPFRSDFEQLAKDNPNFTYIEVVTDSPAPNWQSETGRVDEAMLKKYVEDLNLPVYYLSGPAGMVKAIRQPLLSLEINEDNIRTEEFAGY